MNYRHSFHAGNFADVLKHAVLALVLSELRAKPAPFRIIDTHAGAGRYRLDEGAALKTGEWRSGIGRLLGPDAPPLPERAARLLAPYLSIVRADNPQGRLEHYPGSPCIARALLRADDRLILNELHPADAKGLATLFARDRQTKVLNLDGWTALKALLPPKERRGAVLIDPPFEERDEIARMIKALRDGVARFATGTYILWYPIKDSRPIAAFHRAVAAIGLAKVLAVELMVRAPKDLKQLNGSGLVLLNPPFRLAPALEELLPVLAERLAVGRGASQRVLWLGEK